MVLGGILRKVILELRPNILWDGLKESVKHLVHREDSQFFLAAVMVAILVLAFARPLRFLLSGKLHGFTEPFLAHSSKLELGASVFTWEEDGLQITGIEIRNRQILYENLVHDVRAEAVFTYAGDEVIKIGREQAQFFSCKQNRFVPAGNSVSLELGETAVLALVAHAANRRYVAVSGWPLGLGKVLRYGRWKLEIRVTSDAVEDIDARSFVFQIDPHHQPVWGSVGSETRRKVSVFRLPPGAV